VSLKAALICGGGPKWPDGEKLKRAGVQRLYYEANNPQIDAPFFNQLRQWGYEVGSMRDPSWDGYRDTPTQFIAKVNGDIARFAPKNAQGRRPQLAIMLDIERHDPAYVLACLEAFRDTQPGRNVIWTCEYHQAGWFPPDLIDAINGYPQLRVLPQCYWGSMEGVVSDAAALRDLTSVGVHDGQVCFFYSCREAIPHDWNGALYVENFAQLP
jgi:hypothetical protein